MMTMQAAAAEARRLMGHEHAVLHDVSHVAADQHEYPGGAHLAVATLGGPTGADRLDLSGVTHLSAPE